MSDHRGSGQRGNPLGNLLKLAVFLVFVVVCSTLFSGFLTLAAFSGNNYLLLLAGVATLIYLASLSLW